MTASIEMVEADPRRVLAAWLHRLLPGRYLHEPPGFGFRVVVDRLWPMLFTGALLFSGCTSPVSEDDGGDVSSEGTVAWTSSPLNITCTTTCFEPTLAVVGDTYFLATAIESEIFRSDDLAVWDAVPAPVRPTGAAPSAQNADVTLYGHDGSLYYLAVVGGPGLVFGVPVGFVFEGLHFARSDDRGLTWAVNLLLGPGGTQETVAAERPWLTFANESVHLVWPQWLYSFNALGAWQGVGDGVWMRSSADQGATFGDPVQVMAGRMAFASRAGQDGRMVAASVTDDAQERVLRLAVDEGGWTETVLGRGSLRFPSLLVHDGLPHVAVTHDGAIDVHVNGESRTLQGADHNPSAMLHARPGGGIDLAFARGGELQILRVDAGTLLVDAIAAPAAHVLPLGVDAPVDTDFVQLLYKDGLVLFVGSDGDRLHLIQGPA